MQDALILGLVLPCVLLCPAVHGMTIPLRLSGECLPASVPSGSAQLDKADTELTRIRAGDDRIFPRSLEYTVEECTCEDCVKSKPKGDSDHFFPLPAMEEGATILVTTKTGDYGKSSVPTALQSVMGMEKPTHTR